MDRIKRIYEDFRRISYSTESSVKQFIDDTRMEIDNMASEDMWDDINKMLVDNFPDEDPDDVISIFNRIYGAQVKESGEEDAEPEYDHRNTKNVQGMAYTSQSKSSLGVNQKLTESFLIRRIWDF